MFNALFNAFPRPEFLSFTTAQERKTVTVPFPSVSGLILFGAKGNGKPAVMLLDTGANVTVLPK